VTKGRQNLLTEVAMKQLTHLGFPETRQRNAHKAEAD